MTAQPDRIAVLHVDADEAFTERVGTFLETEDGRFDVTATGSASDALDRLAATRFDCVVSEYLVPGTDGVAFLEAVRERFGDLPFVLYTDSGSEAVASEAISAGVTDYLRKPSKSGPHGPLADRCLEAVRRHRAEERAADLARAREVARDVEQALLHAEDREDVERRVGEVLAGVEPYRFAWIGVHDPEAERIVPQIAAGDGQGYLAEIGITTDDSETSLGPTGRAVNTGEIHVVQDIETARDYEPWREAALARGFRSSAAIPLEYDDGRLGVLNVYADRPLAFEAAERELLAELGEEIAHTVDDLETRAELRRTTARLEALFANSPNMVDIHDAEGRIVTANPRFCEKLGYPEGDLLGTHVCEIDRSLDRGEAAAIWAGMAPGDRYEVEGCYRRRDGSTFPVEVHLQRLDVDGADRFVVISRDISERRRQEREREAIIERVTDAIVRVDGEWRFTLVDERAEELYGMAEEDLLDETFWAVFPEAVGTRFEADYRRVMESREPTSFEDYYGGLDGWFDIQVYPDGDGGLSFYFRETSERKERERELERYETIVETTTDPIFVLDADCRFTKVNNALVEASGRAAEELIGNHLSAVADDSYVRQVEEFLENPGDGASGRATFEAPLVATDGTLRPHATSMAVLEDVGRPPAAILVAHDVTDLRAQQRRVSVLDRVLRHNLRNKLNVIMGHADHLARSSDPAVAERAGTILGTASGLMDLSDSARQFEEVVGGDALWTETIDVAAVVESVVENAGVEHPAADLSADLPGSAPARGHETLELAIDELVENAIVHSDRATPTVEVTVSVDADVVAVCVADDGPGIDEIDRNALMRGAESPLEHAQGLGLWLVRWTIEGLGGEVEIVENAPRGTEVRITLPRASD